MSTSWNVERSAELYSVDGWGAPYFSINARGNLEVRPDPTREQRVDMFDLTEQLGQRGLGAPLLIRFDNILEDRIRSLNACFAQAIREYGYDGRYRGVFPIKVNQQRHLVEAVVELGHPWQYGLEAGSKPELLIALAAMSQADGFIVCNGYKDAQYLETALIAQRLDNTVVVVLERYEELEAVLQAGDRLGIRPTLGVRAKLSSKGMGRWAKSAGDRAKFGLTTAELVSVIDELARREMLDCLQLLHFHIGSQVSSIIPFKNAMREAANLYVELSRMGAAMRFLDVGGGLAVDYDGSRTDFRASMNYGLQEYAYDVVDGIQQACEKAGIPGPTIVTESGRAVAAHQSVLVLEVVGVDEVRFGEPAPRQPGDHAVLEELYTTYHGVAPKNVQESWHDALQARDEARSLFRFGYLGLRDLARAEKLYWHVCEKIQECLTRLKHVPEELAELEDLMACIYYCNFSLFQSAPDTWAVDQLFPIVPLHRLGEEPTMRARLADLTCDSDGMISRFIDREEDRRVLPVHEVVRGQPYLLGIFLTGAYQEILGDLHNLFGDTHAVHVRLTDEGYAIENVIKGDTVEEVFKYVAYDAKELIEQVRRQAERAIGQGHMDIAQMRALMEHYERSIRSYTYLTGEDR